MLCRLTKPQDLVRSRESIMSGEPYSNKTQRYKQMLKALDEGLQKM